MWHDTTPQSGLTCSTGPAGLVPRTPLLQGGISNNLWTYFKTTMGIVWRSALILRQSHQEGNCGSQGVQHMLSTAVLLLKQNGTRGPWGSAEGPCEPRAEPGARCTRHGTGRLPPSSPSQTEPEGGGCLLVSGRLVTLDTPQASWATPHKHWR